MLTAPVHSAWRGRPGSEARRMLGKIGFWIAQHGAWIQLAQRAMIPVSPLRRRGRQRYTNGRCVRGNYNLQSMTQAFTRTETNRKPNLSRSQD
jgi:hypothetical protein